MGKFEKAIAWAIGVAFVLLLVYAIFANGVHSARQDVCDKVGGVYVQTYSRGPQCIQATVVEMK